MVIIESFRTELSKIDPAKKAEQFAQQEQQKVRERFSRYKTAGAAIKLLIDTLNNEDVEEGDLVDLFVDITLPDDLELEKGTDILKLLRVAGTPDHLSRDVAREGAQKLLQAEYAQLLATFNDQFAAAKERIAKTAKEYYDFIRANIGDKKLNISAIATELRKWKSQLKEAME